MLQRQNRRCQNVSSDEGSELLKLLDIVYAEPRRRSVCKGGGQAASTWHLHLMMLAPEGLPR